MQTITTTQIGPASVKTDRRGDGFYEIVVRAPYKSVGGNVGVVGIISRQCVGGKWCVYEPIQQAVTNRFKTKKDAIGYLVSIAHQVSGQ
jgi:hypothetical protein